MTRPLRLARDFLLYHLLMALPAGWRGEPWSSIELWLLPYAGGWAYRDYRDREP